MPFINLYHSQQLAYCMKACSFSCPLQAPEGGRFLLQSPIWMIHTVNLWLHTSETLPDWHQAVGKMTTPTSVLLCTSHWLVRIHYSTQFLSLFSANQQECWTRWHPRDTQFTVPTVPWKIISQLKLLCPLYLTETLQDRLFPQILSVSSSNNYRLPGKQLREAGTNI